jgi:hypothetical protein
MNRTRYRRTEKLEEKCDRPERARAKQGSKSCTRGIKEGRVGPGSGRSYVEEAITKKRIKHVM